MIPISALAAFALLQGPASPTTPAQQTPPVSVPPANPTPPAPPAPDKIVATIGGTPLTAAELAPYLWAYKQREVIQTVALYRGIAAEAARAGVSVTDAEIKAKYDEQISNAAAGLKPGQSLEDAFDRAGGFSGLAMAMKSTLLLDKIAEKEFDPKGYSKLSIILFRSTDDKPPVVTAAKSADTAYKQLKSGTPWNVVEKLFEKQPQLTQSVGSIGWTPVGSLPEDAKTQLAALNVQGYTKPIAMPGGLAIFRLDGLGKDAPAAELAQVKASSLAAARQAVIARIRAASVVEFKG